MSGIMQSFALTKAQWANLLPVMADNLLVDRRTGEDRYYFMGTADEYECAMLRCKYLD